MSVLVMDTLACMTRLRQLAKTNSHRSSLAKQPKGAKIDDICM